MYWPRAVRIDVIAIVRAGDSGKSLQISSVVAVVLLADKIPGGDELCLPLCSL